ncbi:MAG: hypothetical protein H6Q05_429 [Acidobacteria bacterium]|nr:hypothetical protein [Acidobacteriota bacterium]
MTSRKWDADIQLSSDLETAEQSHAEKRDAGRKLVIGVMADFRGPFGRDSVQAGAPLRKRKFLDVDRDNFDAVLARLGVRWQGKLQGVPGAGSEGFPVELEIRSMEDFHPDRIVEQIPALRALHGILAAMEDPARFEAAAAQVLQWTGAEKEPEPASRPSVTPPPVAVDGAELLSAILHEQPQAPAGRASDLDRFVREIVEPHLVRIDTRRQEAMSAAVNEALSIQVRTVLHDPAFRALEALWRSLYRLVLVAGSDTCVCVLQARKEELLEDVMSGGRLEESGLAGLLLERTSVPGSKRFSLLVGGYEFSHGLEDLAVLERMGNIGADLKAPFVAAAHPGLFGLRSYGEMPEAVEMERRMESDDYGPWRLLRKTRAARWLALAAPRLLCRMPYGPGSDPVESFPFQEFAAPAVHEDFVWGGPGFGVAAVFAGAFAEEGWQMNPAEAVPRIDGLPLYVYKEGGEDVTKPCAEALLGERMVEMFMENGILPLVSYRDADIVSFPSLQMLAHPRAPIRL